MWYENFIGLRYLMSKRRSRVLSIITMISIAGVALGVTAMIVVLSVMGGFKKDLKQKILGTKAHIVVEAASGETIDAPNEVARMARDVDGVEGAAAYLEKEVMVSSPTNLSGVLLRGINPDTISEVSEVDEEMRAGEFSHLKDPKPLYDELEKERDERHKSLLDKIEETEKKIDEAQKEKEGEESQAEEGGGATNEENGDGGMPPIVPDDSAGGSADASGETSAESNGGMPPVVPDDSADDSDGPSNEAGGGMPPVVPDDSGDDGDSDQKSADGAPEEPTTVPGIVLGKELARSLQVDVGSEVNVVTPDGEMGPTGMMPRSWPFRVVGIFYTGMYEYDANYGYVHLPTAQRFLEKSGVSGIELRTRNVSEAMQIAERVQSKLGPEYDVLDWKEMNRSLFFALKLEKIAMFVVLAFIILVASFSIIAMLIMIVLEKKRDISILKSMGVTDGGIKRIFIFQGTVIGSVGAAIGLGLGLLICYLLQTVGFPLNSEVYYISTLPVEVNPWEVAAVVGCTIIISLLATLYPSQKASKLQPVEGLRYE